MLAVNIARKCTALMEEGGGPDSIPSVDICSVCLDTNAKTRIIPCGHIFHSVCFLRWYRQNPSCPLCRCIVSDVMMKQAELDVLDDWKLSEDDVNIILKDESMNYEPFNTPTAQPSYWELFQHAARSPLDMIPMIASPVLIAPRLHPVMNTIEPTRAHPCRCSAKCRNGRCACVRAGSVCGITCRCTDCRNPLLPIARMGVSIMGLEKDACLMQNLSKLTSMTHRLRQELILPCCAETVVVYQCIRGYSCNKCHCQYDYSWCQNRLMTPARNHCPKCKKCYLSNNNNCGRCDTCGTSY